MTYPESEFYDCKTLALMYDSDRDVIKRTVHELKDKGHVIEILYWGKQGKMKVHGKQFRRALLRGFSVKALNHYVSNAEKGLNDVIKNIEGGID